MKSDSRVGRQSSHENDSPLRPWKDFDEFDASGCPPGPPGPPAGWAGLSYFTRVIEEVVGQPNTPESYWAYVRRKALTLETQWVTAIRGRTGSATR